MPGVGLTAVRARWDLLLALLPLFQLAESLPTIEDAEGGYYGSTSDYDVHQWKDVVTTLRSDFRLNITQQRLIDINRLSDDDPALEWLPPILQTLLEELEALVEPRLREPEKVEQSRLSPSLVCFPGLVVLRELLRSQERVVANEILGESSHPSEQHAPVAAETTQASFAATHTRPGLARRPLSTLAAFASGFISFPRDISRIMSLRRAVSGFWTALVTLESELNDSEWSTSVSSQAQEYTAEDIETIQHAQEFASACTSLFSKLAEGAKCGTPHHAKLHLSGFREDRLKMTIITCQEKDGVSAVFTRSLDSPSPDPLFVDHICSCSSPNLEGCEVLHVAFNTRGVWASDHDVGPDTTPQQGTEQPLDRLLSHGAGLTLKYRKLAGMLLLASLFQLIDSPWIEPHLGPECIFLPAPGSTQIQQWCPRVLCTLAPRKDVKSQSDSIAAFGVLVLELEANLQAGWTDDDTDWPPTTGERSNHVRLAPGSEGLEG
ncbi:hypothetical protein ACCO45_012843 [Purpureocillium lilacinum]|uniref:Uncharacterized protein n=1 Tax=Purpureocillium lilacinum TaxID=33203 RepID=A0ACC4D956_PURLI